MTPASNPDEELALLIEENHLYPERLVMILWRWDEGDLAGIEQPDTWQMRFNRRLGECLRDRAFDYVNSCRPIKMATGSGRQIGKSAQVAMTVIMLLAAFPDAKITITANTDSQLDTKTWPEILSWLKLSTVAHWFECNSQLIWRKDARETWFCARVNWSLENTQAFAGQGNRRSINVVVFDEASTIPHAIWDITLGGLSTGLPIFLAFGNLTEAQGDFVEAITGPDKVRWDSAESIDARTCRFPNKDKINEEVALYGEDSDYVRVWIRGLPPKSASGAYFPESIIAQAQANRNPGLIDDALIACVDFAWGGRDWNKVRFFHGLDGFSLPPIAVEGEKTEKPDFMIAVLADVLTKTYRPKGNPDGMKVTMLFGDGSGICSQVFRRLRDMGLKNIMEVNFGAHALNMDLHKNMKAQMMADAKEWILGGGGLDTSKDLADDLRHIVALSYSPLQFEDKKKLKERLGRSTDDLDCLIMRGYMPVMLPSVQLAAAGWRSSTPKRPMRRAGSYMG